MFFFKKDIDQILSLEEKKRLQALPRYHQAETSFFGKKLLVNDTCTLLCDIDEIIEKEIYRFYTESQSPVIIDCGANIGISVIFFKKLYPDAKILAFEPDPILFKMLSENIKNFAFKNVTLHQAAIWINDDGVSFASEGGHSGCISNDADIHVKSISLKDILNNLDVIDMLKIDIEGAEDEVIFDCAKHLNKCKNIFIEYHSKKQKRQNLHNILNMLSSYGYRYHIHESFVRKHPFIDKDCIVGMDLQLNLFFYKE